ncbi:hypothetical protein KP004_12715 [Geomonas oryzisoli]|uniref:Uncharacterized protein n=1 Tax=Geomonas oryzisoli TaxID=2847992 RepID=A0ABX8J5T2_9BACT|nr:hypothetical protein [Geomonas oryzisoli]QWV92082.1 hypothetical protein KP004_12715 [Geomonas oryzisoli]
MVAPLKNKNSLDLTGFALVDGGFTYRNKYYKFDDVIETGIARSVLEHKIVLVGSTHHHSVSIRIGMRSGEQLQVTEQPTWLSDSKLSSVEYVENLFQVISKKSWDNRVRKYTNNIDNLGYFEYNGWRFYIKQRKLQDVSNNNYYDLGSVNLFKSYGFIAVKEKNEGLGSKLFKSLVGNQAGIGTLIDSDVFFALLKHFFGISWS